MGSLSIWHWLILALIIIIVFGTGKLRNAGKDLGAAVSDFKKGLNEKDEDKNTAKKNSDDNTD